MKFWHNNLFCLQIRLYYPLTSLNHFLRRKMDVDEMQARLELVNLLVTYKGSIGDSRHDALNRKLRVKIKYNNCLVTCK